MSIELSYQLFFLFKDLYLQVLIPGLKKENLILKVSSQDFICKNMIRFFFYLKKLLGKIESKRSKHTITLKFLRKIFTRKFLK